ncbi:putative zinc-binding metallopeptidase [Alistipes sp. OttesenSCG-928-B03]|nr:putative zinc-binding metallopeptidase [Alistipes sp. OttesenSCG-928-B03]
MKKINIWLCALLVSLFIWTGCESDKFDKSIYVIEEEGMGEVDQWVYDNYVTVYNIQVLYYWRDMETNLALNLTPPKKDDVVPFLKMMHTGWITPYIELCGKEQMKPIFPKQVQLFGSGGYNTNGTVVQGTAEGGKKLILYDLDNFDMSKREDVKAYIRIMHHEFGHLMNQSKEYPLSFKRITPSSYTTGWYNVGGSTAKNSGFVTNYAMAEPDEDFVEVLAEYVTDTPEEWNELLEGVSAAGLDKILKKTDIVRTYMEENYGVDIDLLRNMVIARIDDIIAGNFK